MSDALIELEKKLELLKEVHTQEELEKVKVEVETARLKALSESAEYRQILEERRIEAEAHAEKIKLEYDSKVSDINLRADASIAKAENAKSRAERTRANLMPGILNKQNFSSSSESSLVCPKCGETNLNWMVNGKGKHKAKVPWCFRCNMKMSPTGSKDTPIRNLRPHEAMKDALDRLRGLPH